MDFVHDQLATGRKLRVLTVVDTFTRFAPAIVPRFTSCTLANGSRIKNLPGDAAASRGFSAPTLVLIDEAAYADEALIAAIRPMMSVGQGRLVMMSTPAGARCVA